MRGKHNGEMTYIWDATPTPIGLVVAVFADSALVSLHVTETDPLWEIDRISRLLFETPTHAPGAAHELARQLDEYFAGTRQRFDLTLDWRLAGTGFTADALHTIAEIPYGETASYGDIAALAGRPRAARAVGTACRTTPFSVVVPVHRVVRSDGSVGEYGSSPETKRFLIELERTAVATAATR